MGCRFFLTVGLWQRRRQRETAYRIEHSPSGADKNQEPSASTVATSPKISQTGVSEIVAAPALRGWRQQIQS